MKSGVLFVVIASICLMAMNANAIDNFIFDTEYVEQYEHIVQDLAKDMETAQQGVLKQQQKRTFKLVKCILEEVSTIQSAATSFIADIIACGDEINKKLQELIDVVKDILDTCNDILDLGQVCFDDSNDVGKTIRYKDASNSNYSVLCLGSLLSKLATLSRQILNALKIIFQIISVPAGTSQCILDIITTLASFFTKFAANIRLCYQS